MIHEADNDDHCERYDDALLDWEKIVNEHNIQCRQKFDNQVTKSIKDQLDDGVGQSAKEA